jgi:hypothetical protein
MIGTYTAQNIGMSDDIQNSGFSGANTEETRESHADSVEFTQENEVQAIEADSSKSFEILMASIASLTLIGFLLALWRTLA